VERESNLYVNGKQHRIETYGRKNFGGGGNDWGGMAGSSRMKGTETQVGRLRANVARVNHPKLCKPKRGKRKKQENPNRQFGGEKKRLDRGGAHRPKGVRVSEKGHRGGENAIQRTSVERES